LNKKNGLGLSDAPSKLTVFKPFFVSTTLPYAVKRGEVLTISVQVFNYLDTEKVVDVIMYNEEQKYDFDRDDDDADDGEYGKI
jgi:CD109 antigen